MLGGGLRAIPRDGNSRGLAGNMVTADYDIYRMRSLSSRLFLVSLRHRKNSK
jgi:hypothetical protein